MLLPRLPLLEVGQDDRDHFNLISPAFFEVMMRYPSIQSDDVVTEFIN